MKQWEIIDTCQDCYSTTTCRVEAETREEAIKKHKAGESEYIDGDASIAQGKLVCEEVDE